MGVSLPWNVSVVPQESCKQSDPAAIPLKSLTNGDYERKDGE